MKNKKKLIILSIVAILLIVVLTQASYAYFTTPGSTGSEETISSGTMALSFSDGPQINATNLAPGDYIEKTFSVTNTGTLATTYDVYLSEVVNTFVQKSDLVYELTSNDGGYNTSSEVVVPNQEAKIVDTQSIGVGATHHYTLKITYKLTNLIQNDNMGRGFTAKISINEYNQNTTEKLLKLLDTSGNLVDKQMISSGVTDYYYNLANTSLTGTTNIYCNNGGIPRIENNQLIVSGLTVDTECKMSSDIQDTIANRLTTSKTGIVMTNDQDSITTMELRNKEAIIDLNGKTITGVAVDTTETAWNGNHCGFRLRGSTFTVNDSVGTGGVIVGQDGRAFNPVSDSNLTINGGNFNGRQSICLDNNPNNTVVINGGHFSSKYYEAFIIGAGNTSFTINGGTVDYDARSASLLRMNSSDSTLTINNGTFTSGRVVAIIQSGTAIINGGTFNGDDEENIRNSGADITINGGSFNNNTSSNLLNNSGTTNIYNGNFTTVDSLSLRNLSTLNIYNANVNAGRVAVVTNNDNSNTVIENGTFKAGMHQTLLLSGCSNCNLTVNGGTFIAPDVSSQVVDIYTTDNTGKITLNNGTYIQNRTDSHLITLQNFNENYKSGIIEVNGGTFTSKGYGVLNNNNGTLIINNATIKASGYGVKNDAGATVNINGGYIESDSSNAVNNSLGTTTITGGTFISNSTYSVSNDTSGNLYINQTTKPIYITTKAQIWRPALSSNGVYDSTNEVGIMEVKANKANNCTSNPSDTTSGLCVYADGTKVYNSDASNGAVRLGKKGKLVIDGGTYYAGYQGVNNNSTGLIQIKNAKIISGYSGVLNHTTGEIDVCNTEIDIYANSYISTPQYIHNTSTGVVKYYNITNINPSAIIHNPNGTVTQVSECPF